MESFEIVTEDNFPQEILKSDLPVMAEFGATWCAPCKRLEPELLQLAKQWTGKVRLAKLDVDQAVNLVMQYQIMTVPTLLLFVKGQAVQRLTGFQPRQRIIEKFGEYIP